MCWFNKATGPSSFPSLITASTHFYWSLRKAGESFILATCCYPGEVQASPPQHVCVADRLPLSGSFSATLRRRQAVIPGVPGLGASCAKGTSAHLWYFHGWRHVAYPGRTWKWDGIKRESIIIHYQGVCWGLTAIAPKSTAPLAAARWRHVMESGGALRETTLLTGVINATACNINAPPELRNRSSNIPLRQKASTM